MASTPLPISSGSAGGGASTVSLNATPDAQLEALRSKQSDFTNQLQTNSTKEANVNATSVADTFEGQKNAAKMAALAAGRPWTNADEMEWASRKADAQTKAQNALTLGREQTVSGSMTNEGNTINSQVGQQLQQKQQQLSAMQLAQQSAQAAAELQAQQEYQQAVLKQQQQSAALQQAQALSQLMYGPTGPAPQSFSGPTAGYPAVATSFSNGSVGVGGVGGRGGGVGSVGRIS